MKALSIKQPWAELILQGKKKIEIRKWNTNFRGKFLIHSSKSPDITAMKKFGFKDLPCGFILGKAEIVKVKKYKDNPEEFEADKNLHLATKDWGDYGFILKNVQRMEPIKYNGKLGFWDYKRDRDIFNADSQKQINRVCRYIDSFDLNYPDYHKWVVKCKNELLNNYKKAFLQKKIKRLSALLFFSHIKKKKIF